MTTQGKVRGLSAVLAAIWIIACGSNGSSGTAGSGGTGGKPTDGGEGGAGGEGATNGTGGQKPVSCTANTDPDCECVDGALRGKDADGDGEFSRACAKAPGKDCDDGDDAVTANECGGCSELGAKKGDFCLDCGVYKCDGEESLACKAPSTKAYRCDETPATSSSAGYWDVYECGDDGTWGKTAVDTCYPSSSEACTIDEGCVQTGSYHPRDANFELPKLLRRNAVFDEILERATGFELG